MYKVDLPVDQSVEKAVERRRSAEAARKARIYNTRLRVMGLDTNALDQQVQEKKLLQIMEKQRDRAYEKLSIDLDKALLQQDADEKEKRAALQGDLTKFWATQQRVEDSRDADLKCGLKVAVKVTVPGAEPGPASMQVFQGEAIGEEQMRKEQMRKTERDLQAQMDDNERRHVGEKHREMLVNRELVHQDQKWVEQAALEEACRKTARIALDNYNQALAAEQAEALKERRRKEEKDNLAEKMHILTSEMMTECDDETDVGGGWPPQVLPNRWKGMSAEQLSRFHRERQEQRVERQRQRDTEKFQDAIWDLQHLNLCREAEEKDRREGELRRERRIQMDQYNKQLAREQQAHQQFLDKKLYTNKPTKDYFCQFNTGSR